MDMCMGEWIYAIILECLTPALLKPQCVWSAGCHANNTPSFCGMDCECHHGRTSGLFGAKGRPPNWNF